MDSCCQCFTFLVCQSWRAENTQSWRAENTQSVVVSGGHVEFQRFVVVLVCWWDQWSCHGFVVSSWFEGISSSVVVPSVVVSSSFSCSSLVMFVLDWASTNGQVLRFVNLLYVLPDMMSQSVTIDQQVSEFQMLKAGGCWISLGIQLYGIVVTVYCESADLPY